MRRKICNVSAEWWHSSLLNHLRNSLELVCKTVDDISIISFCHSTECFGNIIYVHWSCKFVKLTFRRNKHLWSIERISIDERVKQARKTKLFKKHQKSAKLEFYFILWSRVILLKMQNLELSEFPSFLL